MSAFINIVGFVCFLMVLSLWLKKDILDVMPIGLACLIMVLLGLGMIGKLRYIDIVFCVLIIAAAFLFVKKKAYKDIKAKLFNIYFVVFFLACVGMTLLEKDRLAADWDELGCWALEVKTLFKLGGFSSYGMHTTIGYADYFPGQMLFEWWVCHFAGTENFIDGLMFAGYYIFYQCIMFSVWNCISERITLSGKARVLLTVIYGLLIMILPSSVSIFEYKMLSVEFLQSASVTAMLVNMVRQSNKEKTDLYDILNFCALIIVFTMLKDSSVYFIACIIVMAIVLKIATKKNYISVRQLMAGVCSLGFTCVIWKSFVKFAGRGTPLSRSRYILRNALRFFRSGMNDEEVIGYTKSYLESITEFPLHLTRSFGLNFSVVGVMLLTTIAIYLLYKFKILKIGKKEAVILSASYLLMTAAYHAALLGMHMFGFRETQYLEPATMMYTISRYGEPLFLGWLLFVFVYIFAALHREKKYLAVLSFIILLSADAKYVKYICTGYHAAAKSAIATESEYKENNQILFEDDEESRVLYIYNSDITDFNTRRLQYMAAPKAIYYCDVKNDANYKETIENAVNGDAYDFYFVKAESVGDTFGVSEDALLTGEEMLQLLTKVQE